MRTFADVFAEFGGPTRLAEAIGIKPFHAQTMKARASIPPGYWPRVVAAAKERGIEGITFEALAEIAAAKQSPADPPPPSEPAQAAS